MARKFTFPSVEPELGTLRLLVIAIHYLSVYHVEAIGTRIQTLRFCPLSLTSDQQGWQPPLSMDPCGASSQLTAEAVDM